MIHLKGISLEVKGKKMLDNITSVFDSGKIHGIVGKNGSGKTLLLKTMCGYLKPTTGTVTILDKILYEEIDFPPSMGIIIENPGFLPYASAKQNLIWLAQIKNKIDKNRIKEVFEIVGLKGEEQKLVSQYSLGMRQKLGIAQAIMENPDLLILDEPFNSLDEQAVQLIRKLLLSLRETKHTIILTSHNKEDIEILCDTVHTMIDGKMLKIN